MCRLRHSIAGGVSFDIPKLLVKFKWKSVIGSDFFLALILLLPNPVTKPISPSMLLINLPSVDLNSFIARFALRLLVEVFDFLGVWYLAQSRVFDKFQNIPLSIEVLAAVVKRSHDPNPVFSRLVFKPFSD